MMNNYRESPSQQRRQELNPLTTQLSAVQLQAQAPPSALSARTPYAGYHQPYTPASAVPSSAVRSYNPMQWGASPQDGPQHTTQFALAQDIEVPAPPPYSPPRSQRPAGLSPEEPPSAVSPANRIPSSSYRPSPEIPQNTAFPPPPGQTRGTSRDRHHIFSLSAFRKSSAPGDAARASPEPSRDHAGPLRAAAQAGPSHGYSHSMSPAGPSQGGPSRQRPVPIATNIPTASVEQDIAPPAARRAASADAVSLARSRASSTTRWGPNMVIPPPPPGPPPAGSRSQSMSRTQDLVITSPPTRRPAQVSTLGPVPPTPADWVEENNDATARGRTPEIPLQIDTNVASSPQDPGSGSSSSGLARTRAVRGEPKSIRERRSESRTGKNVVRNEPSNNPWAEAITPSDIVVGPFSNSLNRGPASKSTPRSGRALQSIDTPNSSKTPQPSASFLSPVSHASTPRPSRDVSGTSTPPFSQESHRLTPAQESPQIPPKALPTPPPQSKLNQASPRPVSHILHMPNNDSVASTPLSPARPPSATMAEHTSEQFSQAAIERHNAFVAREAAALTDAERVRIFADFIVTESRIRRGRYSAAIDALGSEILELTRDLFRPYPQTRRESTNSRSSDWQQPEASGRTSAQSMRSHHGSLAAALHETSREASEPRSAAPSPSPGHIRPESQWWSGYMPSLSPIPSMSVSEAPDESSSRGRPSSRWWEVSQSGSVGTPAARLERHSKRESKYMGMPKELREAMQYDVDQASSSGQLSGSGTAGPSTQTTYASDEYPPEKVGWHEPLTAHSVQSATSKSSAYSSTVYTPDPRHLDVSRLVTLPPPYPRHHPAVENNHPDLTSIRTTVRGLSDLKEIKSTKQRFLELDAQHREEAEIASSKRKDSMRVSIQREIEAGNITYADAAKIEASSAATDNESAKETEKASFERFQTDVVTPLNDLLMDRVTRATTLFDQLRSKLFDDARDQSHNQTQEEGDEQPELLEKLTLLKWIFEAREQLHRELYDLLTDRNNRYRDLVILPYRHAGNEVKVKNAEAFFEDDAAKRKLAFEQESLKRTEEFGEIVENNVVRGVEVQLSAFWDIAPGLRSIIEKVPVKQDKLYSFKVQIPQSEYEENPGYWEHPMQYLYSLLLHAEKSSYQFIESQTNLLCLLHEVKGLVTAANCRLMETQRIGQNEDKDIVLAEMRDVRDGEDRRLTDDLKEKVKCVDEQWLEGLGNEMNGVKARVAEFLVATGGWEEENAS